jgi:PA14 domain
MKKLSLGVVFIVLLILAACAQPPRPDPSNSEQVDTSALGGTGLTGIYFNNMDFTGTQKTRVDTIINKTWTGNPIVGIAGTTYSIRWTGQVVPAFSEEYTFYLTHTDGARLAVNGIPVINNWKDHAQTTDSGKITLRAGVKYDIRLEYYRNATNPSLVKLEWQSIKRTRQLVPKDRLFATGSNAQIALTALKADTRFTALSITLNDATANGTLTNRGFSLSASENNGDDVLYAMVNLSTSQVTSLMRHTIQGRKVIVTDVLTGRSVTIDDFISYFNSDGTISPTQLKALLDKVSLLLVNENMIGVLQGIDLSTSGRIQAQAVNPSWICPNCKEQAKELARALVGFSAGVAVQISTEVISRTQDVFNPPKTVAEIIIYIGEEVCGEFDVCEPITTIKTIAEGDFVSVVGEVAEGYTDAVEEMVTKDGGLIDLLENCVQQFCPPPDLTGPVVNPKPAKGRAEQNIPISVNFGNNARSSDKLEFYIVKGAVDNLLILNFAQGAVLSGEIAPGAVYDLPLTVRCVTDVIPQVLHGTVLIRTNEITDNLHKVDIEVNCATSTFSITPKTLKSTWFFYQVKYEARDRITNNLFPVNWSTDSPRVAPLLPGGSSTAEFRPPQRMGRYNIFATNPNDANDKDQATLDVTHPQFDNYTMGASKITRGLGSGTRVGNGQIRCFHEVYYDVYLTQDNRMTAGYTEPTLPYNYLKIKEDVYISYEDTVPELPNACDGTQQIFLTRLNASIDSELSNVSQTWRQSLLQGPGIEFRLGSSSVSRTTCTNGMNQIYFVCYNINLLAP